MSIDREWLKKHSAFPEMNDALLDALLNIASEREYADRDVIYTELEDFDEVLLVTNGSLHQRSALFDFEEEPDEMKVMVGHFSNEVRLVSDLPSTLTCTAHGNVKVLCWQTSDLKEFCEKNPEIHFQIVKKIASEVVRRLYGMNQMLLNNVSWGLG